MEIINSVLDSKLITAVIVIAVFFLNFRPAFFKGIPATLRKLSFETYLIILAAVSAFFFAALFFDQIISSFVLEQKTGLGPILNAAGAQLSKNTRFWLVLSGLFLGSYALKKTEVARIFFGAMCAAALTGLGSQTLKFSLARARPYSEEGPFSFFNYADLNKHAYQSLPSGDVAIVAGASAYLFYSVKNLFWRCVILILPLCTAYYRVHENKHWPSDTLISGGMGFLFALMVLDFKKNHGR